jgi:benzodiazapine receptor
LALVFAINLVSNLLFMLIFAGMRNVSLAAMDVVLMWATIIWCIVAVWRHYRWIAVAQIPYLTWASIDMVMHLSIEVMNW